MDVSEEELSPEHETLPDTEQVDVARLRELYNPDARLILSYRGQDFEVAPQMRVFVLGRGSQAELSVDARSVSRQHARIIYRQGKFVLIDQSKNGTYVRQAGASEVCLLQEDEFLDQPASFRFDDLTGQPREVSVPAGGLAFTLCQVPVVYEKTEGEGWTRAVLSGGETRERKGVYLDEETNTLFASQKLEGDSGSQELGSNPIVQKWWAYMADIMETNPDNSPVTHFIDEVFHMD